MVIIYRIKYDEFGGKVADRVWFGWKFIELLFYFCLFQKVHLPE